MHMLETTMAINSMANLSTQLPSFLKYAFYFKLTFKATETCKINYICYYFGEHTVHLVQFVIQTKKCTTHPHKGNNKNIGITPKRQSRLYIQPPSLQLPCTVITTADTAHSVLETVFYH